MLDVCGFIRSLVTVSMILKGLHSKPHEVSRYLPVALNGFGSDLSCSLVIMYLPWSGGDRTVTTQKELCWFYYKILSKY